MTSSFEPREVLDEVMPLRIASADRVALEKAAAEIGINRSQLARAIFKEWLANRKQ